MTLTDSTSNYDTLIMEEDLSSISSPPKSGRSRLVLLSLAVVLTGLSAGVLYAQPWKSQVEEDGMVSTADMGTSNPCWNAMDEWVCSDELYDLRDPSEWEFKDEWREAWRPGISDQVFPWDQEEQQQAEKYQVEVPVRIPSLEQHEQLVHYLKEDFFGIDFEEFAVHVIRGTFHDAFTYDQASDTGGANACHAIPGSLQWACKDNDGTRIETARLWAIYEKYQLSTIVSMADFYHLSATIALWLVSHKAEVEGTGVTIDVVNNFKYGRTPCTDQGWDVSNTCGYAERIPAPHLSWAEMERDYLSAGLAAKDIVCLNNAHSVGGMGNHGPALAGGFTMSDSVFDNRYAKTLLQYGMKPAKVKKFKPRTQFKGSFNPTDQFSQCTTAPVDAAGMPMKQVSKKFGANCWVPSDYPGCYKGKGCLLPGSVIPEDCPECSIGPTPAEMLCCQELSAFKTDLEVIMDTTYVKTFERVSRDGEVKTHTKKCETNHHDLKKGDFKCPEQPNGMLEMVTAIAQSPEVLAKEYAQCHQTMAELGSDKLFPPGETSQSWLVTKTASDLGMPIDWRMGA